ncbi:MAG: SMP-30/gluconolactonase/LRE family protein, partial [Acetobacter sp.]
MSLPTGRRTFLAATLGAVLTSGARAAPPRPPAPDVTTHPPRSWGGKAPTGYLPAPDILPLAPSFKA